MKALRPLLLSVAVGGLLGTAAPASSAATTTTLRTGFLDQSVMALEGGTRTAWLGRASSVGASVIRVNMSWAGVAPSAPPAGSATDPGWSGYRFAEMDGEIRAAQAAGMTVLLGVTQAPAWAEGAGKTKQDVGLPGNYKPDVAAFGAFMTAVAKRYSGATPDPAAAGTMLPRVTDFQVWNEPNLNLHLAPQYEGGKPFAPVRWRELLNAGNASVKAVQPSANVVAGGLAPYGDPVSDNAKRTRPVSFLRSTLCLSASNKRACGDITRADTFSLHPYAVDRPSRSARDANDATIPDVGRIDAVLTAARRAGTVGPAKPKLWVTEVSYDSSPPDPDGVPLATRARYISETMWRLWRSGVSTVVWYLMRDDAPKPSFASSYQSGIFYRDGRRKSDARAFRFPLLVTGSNSKRMNVWLRTPSASTTYVQVRRGGKWKTVNRGKLPLDGVARVKVPRSRVTAVRAISGKATSYVWTVKK